jgi:hypothetical protein
MPTVCEHMKPPTKPPHNDVATGGDEFCLPCMWFALCENDAETTRRGPIGDGKFGDIPICHRCNDRVERLS